MHGDGEEVQILFDSNGESVTIILNNDHNDDANPFPQSGSNYVFGSDCGVGHLRVRLLSKFLSCVAQMFGRYLRLLFKTS